MPRGSSSLKIATPFEWGRALLGNGGYHAGVPHEGLSAYAFSDPVSVPLFTAADPLKTGDHYVAPLSSWLEFLVGYGWTSEAVQQVLSRILQSQKAVAASRVLGFIPLALRIPALGGPMVYVPHSRIILDGHYGASATSEVERFSFSMAYSTVGPSGAPPAELAEGALEDVLAAWAAGWANSDLSITNEAWLEGIAYAAIGANGLMVGSEYQRAVLATPVAGAATTATHWPLSMATAITLDAHGGRKGRFGRFYLPAVSAPLTLGLYQPANALQTVTAVQAVLAAANDAMTAGLGAAAELVVASGVGAGALRPVRELRMGLVPDTMRSRRRSLSEAYQVVDFQT